MKQQFLLPEAFVFYIAMNPPSPEVYHKLIKCCKYFWLKNPIITLSGFQRASRDEYWKIFEINGFQNYQEMKVENMNEKLWFHQVLTVFGDSNHLMASSLIPRIYRCDLTFLGLQQQTLTFCEFQKFTSSGSLEILNLFKVTVKNYDGTIVPLEKLIELSPKLQSFIYDNVPVEEGGLQTITSETAANLVAIPHFPKIVSVTIEECPESFNIESFFAVPKVTYFLCFF